MRPWTRGNRVAGVIAGGPMGSGDFDLADAYAVETPEDNRNLYARWADTYESGLSPTTPTATT